jgi:chloride channel protein, CIC family
VVMIFEITRDYAVIVPLMIANLVSYLVASKLQKDPIYEVLAHQDGIHLPMRGRAAATVRRVSQIMRAATEVLDAKLSANEAAANRSTSSLHAWPVVGERGVIGVISLGELKELASDGITRPLGELLEGKDFPHLHADHSLDAALERMGEMKLDVLPVVGRANVRELEGIVTLADVLAEYGVGPKVGP